MNEDALKKIVLENIKSHAAAIMCDEGRMVTELCKRLIGDFSTDRAETQRVLRELKQRLHNLDVKLEQLYEDKVTGVISIDTFSALAAKTEAKRNEIAERVMLMEQNTSETKARHSDIQNWVRLIKENAAITEITRSLLDTLVERVAIGEKRIENGVKTQDICIIYRFVGVV